MIKAGGNPEKAKHWIPGQARNDGMETRLDEEYFFAFRSWSY
jgi:hypothetical protein